ncbi:MAG: Crp/Fnr family transcriptional regulator, partial [Bacteroidota bacterium]
KNNHKAGSEQFDLTTLFSTAKLKKYPLNGVIFTPLQFNSTVYFIKSGKVKVTDVSDKGRRVSSGYYKAGAFINLEVLKQTSQKKMTAISKSKNTEVVVIHKQDFLLKLSLVTELQQHVFNQLLADKVETERRIHRILDIKSGQRVYDFFYAHVQKFGERIGYEYVVREPLTHQEIAEYIGTSRQTVTTSMNELKRKGILHFNRKYWIIRSLQQLEEMVYAS